MQILIATTNEGKYKEMKKYLDDLPFEFLGLKDLDVEIEVPEETGETMEENALLKAKYYAEKSGLPTLSEDTGLFIDELDGWPAIKAARMGIDNDDRQKIILDKMKNIPEEKRSAAVRLAMTLHDPNTKNTFSTFGETYGSITREPVIQNGFGFDPIFFVTEKNKTFSEMTPEEKNAISHRGKALSKMKYILQNQYGAKHIVVPCALIIKEGKLLITLRNDPHRPETHRKWEFPGGICDFGETIETTIIKEAKEEVGLDVEPIKQLSKIKVKDHPFPGFSYQVYLIPVVSKIVGSDKITLNDTEVLDYKWIDPTIHNDYEFLEDDNAFLDELMPELKKVIEDNNL